MLKKGLEGAKRPKVKLGLLAYWRRLLISGNV